jgi:hypothetical protein
MYFQFFFAMDRIKTLAPQHPEWQTKEPFASLLNPLFPALRSAPTAVSGASRQKQIPSSQPFTYTISGNAITVKLGEIRESYFMQADLREIYQVVPEGRFAGNRKWYGRRK